MDKYLDEKLIEHSRSDVYPFHMPGHKRQRMGDFVPEDIDITETKGIEDLHHAGGILLEGQRRLARVFGADESFYLVNGSTAGILAAVCGCLKRGDRIIIARNCHKSVYHAAYLMEAQAEYVYPEPVDFGIQGCIAPESVAEKLAVFPETKAVVITSPTYDGIVSDIKAIADIVHACGIPLIVDEAHGAHFGFSDGFPKKALALGADLCVESLHKTLPAYTQTAALHMMRTKAEKTGDGLHSPESDKDSTKKQTGVRNIKDEAAGQDSCRGMRYRFDDRRVRRYLDIFQSSSPSYVLMAGIDRCVRMVEEDIENYHNPDSGRESMFAHFEERLEVFYKKCEGFRYVEIFPYVNVRTTEISEKTSAESELKSGLASRPFCGERHYEHLMSEMSLVRARAELRTVQFFEQDPITCVNIYNKDNSKILISATRSGLSGQQLYDLLLERYHLQMEMAAGHYVTALTTIMDTDEGFERLYAALKEIDESGGTSCGRELAPVNLYSPQEKRMEISEAMDADFRTVSLSEAAGLISAGFICLYPPGIPIIVPGELITDDMIRMLDVCWKHGLQLQGLTDDANIRVI